MAVESFFYGFLLRFDRYADIPLLRTKHKCSTVSFWTFANRRLINDVSDHVVRSPRFYTACIAPGVRYQRSRGSPREGGTYGARLEINQIRYYDNGNVFGLRTSLRGFNSIRLKPRFRIPYVFQRWIF